MIYCKQIPPEYQDSLLFDDEGMGPDYINVTGNRDYISRTSPLFDRVYNALENGELAEALDDIKNGGYYSSFYKNATQAINDLLEPDKARYSTRDIHALKELVNAYKEAGSREENNILLQGLSVVTAVNGDCELSGVVAKVIGTKFFTPWTIGAGKRWPLLKQCILTLVQSGLYTMKENTPEGPGRGKRV